MRQLFALALIALVGLTGPTLAADLSVAERSRLDLRLGELTDASLKNDAALIAALLPPTVYQHFGDQNGTTAAEAKENLINRIKSRQSSGQIQWQIVLFETTVEGEPVRVMKDGRKYMYVPIKLHDAKGTALHERTYAMFAVQENDGDWYFYPIPKMSNANFLAGLFPGIETGSIPEPTREKLHD